MPFPLVPAPEEIQVASQQQVLEDGTWCREQQLLFRPGRTEAVGTTDRWDQGRDSRGDQCLVVWNMAFIMGIFVNDG